MAGAGTGKTYTFKRALSAVGDRGLALTFIRALERELRRDLPETVEVRSFYSHCLYLLRTTFGSEPVLYPALPQLIAKDLMRLRGTTISASQVTRTYHELDGSNDLLAEAARLETYYRAVSFAGVVYRLLRLLESEPDRVPTYQLIVVDEYQDFSRLEARFIHVLGSRSPLLAAGDDDQALYGFKPASPARIRELAHEPETAVFPLPFCSRCTEVIVMAVTQVVAAAQATGHLNGRLEKPYICYLPVKAADSAAYPRIISAVITSQDWNDTNDVGRYVLDAIQRIPTADIDESHAQNYPTALVVGAEPFIEHVERALRRGFRGKVTRSESKSFGIDEVYGYWLLAQNPRSRLGWRILLARFPNDDANAVLRQVLTNETEIADVLPDAYRDEHLELARLVGSIVAQEPLGEVDSERVSRRLRRTATDIREAVLNPSGREDPGPAEVTPSQDESRPFPTVSCTTILGSKGLQAGHVFVVGMMERYLPLLQGVISDNEICSFIVAITRTKKECHLISCVNYIGQEWKPSPFLAWISNLLEERTIGQEFFTGR